MNNELINHGLKFVRTIPSARSDNTQRAHECTKDPQAFLENTDAPTNQRYNASSDEWLLAALTYYPKLICFAFPYGACQPPPATFTLHRRNFSHKHTKTKNCSRKLSPQHKLPSDRSDSRLSYTFPQSTGRRVIDILSDVFTGITMPYYVL